MRKIEKVNPRIPEVEEAILDSSEQSTEEYSKNVKKYNRMDYRRLIKFLVKDLGIKNHSKILEIGPGPGWIGIWLAKKDKSIKIIGLEMSEDMIRVANKNKKLEGVQNQVSYVLGDAKNMYEFSDDTFDVVISSYSLHHWREPKKVFDEIARVLKKDGKFCVFDVRRDVNKRGKFLLNVGKSFIPKSAMI